MRLWLASRSPRRAALLDAAGFRFEIDTTLTVDETPTADERPHRYVERLAAAKAALIAAVHPADCVIGADTAVVVLGRLLGKPADDAEAAEMLGLLSDRTHQVLTGVSVTCEGRRASAVEMTLVRFARLSDEEIAWYVASGEPMGKAGAYAIQGLASRFVTEIDGSYSNVVGLPIATLYRLLHEVGALDTPPARRRP